MRYELGCWVGGVDATLLLSDVSVAVTVAKAVAQAGARWRAAGGGTCHGFATVTHLPHVFVALEHELALRAQGCLPFPR